MNIRSECVPTETKYGEIEIDGVPFVDAIQLSQWTGEIGQDGRNTITLAVSDICRLAETLNDVYRDFRRNGSPTWNEHIKFHPTHTEDAGQ